MRPRPATSAHREGGRAMNTLMSILVLWLSASFGLPANYEHPRVTLVPADKIASLYYRGLATRPPGAGTDQRGQRTIVAVYDDRARTIYLREDWKGTSRAELSVLVHELVHHLQNLGRLKYACPQEREALAYAAQERW